MLCIIEISTFSKQEVKIFITIEISISQIMSNFSTFHILTLPVNLHNIYKVQHLVVYGGNNLLSRLQLLKHGITPSSASYFGQTRSSTENFFFLL